MSVFTCSGLVKPKKYDWKDSNLALFGSDTEKQVKSKHNFHLLYSVAYFFICVILIYYSASALLAMQTAVIARGYLSVCPSVTFRCFCPDE